MKENVKKKYRASVLSRNPYKRRSESELIKIIREVNSGIISKRAACVKYGINRNTLALFIRKLSVRTLSDELSGQLLLGMSGDQQSKALIKRVKELTKALEYSKLKSDGLEMMIKVAEEDLHIKIKKKRGTKRSKE